MIALWGGVECSVVRVGNRFVDEVELTGHGARLDDLDRIAALGIRTVRYPVVWERVWPVPHQAPDWRFTDERLGRLRELGIRPIVGLVHHGSGPRHTDLLSDSFATGLAVFARMVAERYPWIEDYTPVNEPLTTARFSGLYGHWYPHHRDHASFVRALVVECLGVRAAMKAIRLVQPAARLVQTEDIGTVFATDTLAHQAEFENQRRFLSLDLLSGRVDDDHPLRRHLGGVEAMLASLVDEPCPPDVIGVNHYVTSDRFLDERLERYPAHTHGGNGRQAYADVEAVRVLGAGIAGFRGALDAVWSRYRRPIAITEAHLGASPDEQIRWLVEAWSHARAAAEAGADIRAVTVWSLFGATDWDSLLTQARGRYEPGVFDIRGGEVRPTPLARVAADLALRGRTEHPFASTPGWWRQPERLLYPVVDAARSRRPQPCGSVPSPAW